MNQLLSALQNRADLSTIANWIEPGSRVLDLGCGDGSLLDYLIKNKNVKGNGVEINLDRTIACISKGIPVIEHDLNEKFKEIGDQTYDYVILSQTIQEVAHPAILIEEILRIGKCGIISFPNFGSIWIRSQLFFKGRMPKSKDLPFEWYDTPNIHLLTISDFSHFCKDRKIKMINTIHFVANRFRRSPFFPNLFSDGCVVLISK